MKRNDIMFIGLAASAAIGLAEASLRLRDRAASKTRFHRERWTIERSWERFDPRSGWELKPDFVSEGVMVNRHGFRGPELSEGETFRIVCLGGSATFGPRGEESTYPRALEASLNRLSPGKPVEVVNAGVTGHSSYHMRFRADRILRLHPDLVVILAGPEDMMTEDIARYRDNRQPFTSYWHVDSQRNVGLHVWSLFVETAGLGARKPSPLSYAPEEFIPFNFQYNLSFVLDTFRKAGVPAAVLTIPSRLAGDPLNLTPEDIRTIALPDYMDDDLSAFIAIYRSYNAIIRAVALESGATLIDAAEKFERTDGVGSDFFTDTFELSPAGCAHLGDIVARGLNERGIPA